ncbi:MAG: T9SS type A sorting domain-containing protein [Flavobacteriales bacterium]
MKYFYTGLLLFISAAHCMAQVEITTSNLPQANDILVTQNATLLQEVDLEATGENVTWDFGPEILMYMGTNNNTTCYDVDNTPIAYQFLFNNPFDPEHNSDFGLGIESIEVGTFTFEDAYQYYQNNSSKYAVTGMGVTISGIPIAAVANDPDVIYDLPLNYNDADSSDTEMEFTIPTIGYWGSNQQREYMVDGWGTLEINGLSIDVLRYKAVINGTDSLYSDLFTFGTTLPRPETVEYRWLSPLYNVPVLQITTQGGFVTTVLTANIFASSITEIADNNLVYPNPACDIVSIQNGPAASELSIFTIGGQLIQSFKASSNQSIDISAYAPGIYFIRMEHNGSIEHIRFVKE